MCKFICRQWKNRKVTVLFIIIGFMVGSFVMSLGISVCKDSFEYMDDQMRGDPKQQLDIYLSSGNVWNQEDAEKVIENLSCYGEVQILSMGSHKPENFDESCPVVPVFFHQEPDWHVPLLEGRYFSVDEMDDSEKTIVLGKQLAMKYHISLEDMVNIGGENFRVIGICGRPARETSWEYAIYMPWLDYLKVYPNCFGDLDEEDSITIHLEKGKDKLLENMDQYINEAAEKNIQMVYRQVDEEVDTSSVKNTLILTAVSTVLVFSVAVINIVHLMLYWMMERRREIGIMKALGADNIAIIRVVILEVLTMSCIGCLAAVLIQYFFVQMFMESSAGKLLLFRVTWENLVYAMGVSMLFGMAAAISPAKTAMCFEPISVISNQ